MKKLLILLAIVSFGAIIACSSNNSSEATNVDTTQTEVLVDTTLSVDSTNVQ